MTVRPPLTCPRPPPRPVVWGTDSLETKADSSGIPARSHVFLLARRIFQSPHDKSKPLDKVTDVVAFPQVIPPDDAGYRQPAKGNTQYPFRFQLPADLGSSVECGMECRTRYTLTGYAKVRILGSFETLIDSVEVPNVFGRCLMVG